MQIRTVSYETIKLLLTQTPAFYQVLPGQYQLFSVSDLFFLSCRIPDAESIADFEANYLALCTKVDSGDDAIVQGTLQLGPVVLPRSEDGKPATVASVIANSGYSPDPTSYPNGVLPSAIDADNNQQIRGPVLTDEGAFRDDFPGTSMQQSIPGTCTFVNGGTRVTGSGTSFRTDLDTDAHIWLDADGSNAGQRVSVILSDTELELDTPYSGTGGTGAASQSHWMLYLVGGTLTVANSKVTLTSGTAEMSYASISRAIDFEPLRMAALLSVSQRDANQRVSVGAVDRLIGPNYDDIAAVLFEGTDDTVVTFVTGCQGTVEETEVTLPAGQHTNVEQMYEIELNPLMATLLINGKLVVSHKRHIPRPYTPLIFGAAVWNMAESTSGTSVTLDNYVVVNHNVVQVGGNFLSGDPLATRLTEESHTISATLTTNTTEPDQVLIEFVVPTDHTLYLTGYSISAPNNSVCGDPIKIGRNDVSVEPASPGVIDSNLLRIFRIESGMRETEDWSANPRLLGGGGDTIRVTVTPNGSLDSVWRVTLDYVLR